jgi:hypothetical protein
VGALAAFGAVQATAAGAATVNPDQLTTVPNANVKVRGRSVPNKLSRGIAEVQQATGSDLIDGADPAVAPAFYGYSFTNDSTPLVPIPPSPAEAQKTEPDKNTYLVLDGQKGADPSYDYGTHFVFQGHEAGTPGYITRVNLDADRDHRVTLLASKDASGAALPAFDGSTWDPFAHRLLFTAENGNKGGVWQATLDVPSKVEDISGMLGRGGYEGIQNDSDGNVWFVEDVGGDTIAAFPKSRQPNSFVYRFVPKDKSDLTKGGRLQVLQVKSLHTGDPIVFHADDPALDINGQDTQDLHTYGHTFDTAWVTIHDTATDGTDPFDANALAKKKGGTPFKRPENGVFQPGTGFRTFVFTETGDTNLETKVGAAGGGFGAIQQLDQKSPSANEGRLHLFFQGDPEHAAFDNIQWLTDRTVVAVEDRGDTLHSQGNGVQSTALDSGWAFDAEADYSKKDDEPVRILAEGRDPSATIDSALLDAKTPGFHNDGDNEITGFHVSDGDPSMRGILGAKDPQPWASWGGHGDRHGNNSHGGDDEGGAAWRVFFSQQHGDNNLWELIPKP